MDFNPLSNKIVLSVVAFLIIMYPEIEKDY